MSKVEIRNDKEVINFIFKGSPWFPIDNFYPDAVCEFEGLTYENSEAAFQSAKTLDMSVRKLFTEMSPSQAKFVGKNPAIIKLRPDWNEVKFGIMRNIVRSKMDLNPYCRDMLIKTGDAEIIEGTYWNDRIWGIDLHTGIGDNWLGKILMELREYYKTIFPEMEEENEYDEEDEDEEEWGESYDNDDDQ